MCAREGLVIALQAIVGAEHLLTGAAAAAYAIDGVPPAMVVFPEEEEQVAAILRIADEHNASVFPRGGGSYMGLGHTPTQVDVVLCLQRLRRQIAYVPADLTVTVQAGMRLADLQQTLRQQGQFLALDPPAAEMATVGGVVATNRSGPRRLLYGTARDMLLGTAVITAEGKRAKAGGRVVKNVAGYDLNKLYIGSLGTLAVLVELTFKLYPLPPGEQTLGIGIGHLDDVLPVLQTLMQTPLRLSSLELLNRTATAAITTKAGIPEPEGAYLVLVRVEGSPAVTKRQEEKINTALRRLSLRGKPHLLIWEQEQQERLWRSIEAFPVATSTDIPPSVLCKVSLLMSDLPALLQEVHTASAQGETIWPVLAHAGSGIAYINVLPRDPATADPEAMVHQLQTLDTWIARWHGRRVIERAPIAVKQHCQVWGSPGEDFALMQALKAAFDPRRRLNPGRFIGGI